MDKLSAIIAFISVAETGSFTKAAERMNLPKARISQRVKDLETELGVRLFERSTRAVRMTAAGSEYLMECKTLVTSLSLVEQSLKGDKDSLSGKLTIDVLPPFSRWVLAPFINQFLHNYPDIRLNLRSSDELINVIEQNVDLVIRGGVLEDSSLIVRPLCVIPFQLYASPWVAQYLADKKMPAVLSTQQLISWFPDDETELKWSLHSQHESQLIRSISHTYISDQDMALEVASTGRGICPGMYLAANSYVRRGLLIPVMKDWALTPKQVSVLYPSKTHLPKKVEIFIDWLSDIVRQLDFSRSH